MLTNLSTEHLIGRNGDAFHHTIAVTAWETTVAMAMVATALFFLPCHLRMSLSTIPLTYTQSESVRLHRGVKAILLPVVHVTQSKDTRTCRATAGGVLLCSGVDAHSMRRETQEGR